MYRARIKVKNCTCKTPNIEPSIAPNFLKGTMSGLEPRIALEKTSDIALDIALGLTPKFALGK